MPWTQQQKPPHYLIVFPNKHRTLWERLNDHCDKESVTKAVFIRKAIEEKMEKECID